MIQGATGRPVIGFMSGNQQEPDMICEVFVLSPTDLVEEAELRAVSEARAAGAASGSGRAAIAYSASVR